jgi:L-lactate dehydrogenase
MNKVVIVGCGNVGMAYAYALVISGSFVDELVLIDINKQKAEGEALDLNHANAYAPKKMVIKSGDYSECDDADIVCICAGANQAIGETRTDLTNKNIKVFRSIISEINKTKFSGIYLVATNPLDTMTYATMKLSKFQPNRVLGSGTTLDTARLKYMIGKELGANSKDVHAYVLGEHGDSEFVAWENAIVGGNKCTEWLTAEQMENISHAVKTSAYEVIEKKGNTSYGIGMCLLKITNAILNNERSILTVSCYNIEHDVYFSKPAIIGKNGVEKELYINLNEKDTQNLISSIHALAKTRDLIK